MEHEGAKYPIQKALSEQNYLGGKNSRKNMDNVWKNHTNKGKKSIITAKNRIAEIMGIFFWICYTVYQVNHQIEALLIYTVQSRCHDDFDALALYRRQGTSHHYADMSVTTM